MFNTFTKRVRKAFTDAADQYDILTSLHKEIGRELVKKVVKMNAPRILDVGCGTGYAANKAKFFFPESVIIGLDLSEGMIIKARQLHEGIPIDWLQADAQLLPFKDRSFNLILSNLAYQWVRDLPASFKEANRVLVPQGTFNITMFGSRTCEELFESINAVIPNLKIRALPSLEEIQNAMDQAGFAEGSVDYEIIKVEFKNVRELLGWLKNIGANRLSDDVFLGKQNLAKIEEYYRTNHAYNEGISASFEVIWAEATTEGESTNA